MVVPTLRSAPTTVIRRAPSPAAPSSRASASIASSGTPAAARAASSTLAAGTDHGPAHVERGSLDGGPVPSASALAGGTTGATDDGTAAACAGGAPSNALVSTKPADSANMASAATSTVGSFFGHDGVLETTAVEMMRASGEAAPMLSRAVASRYLAKVGFEQIALRLGIALERAQLHVLLVARGGLALELVEAGAERIDLGACELGVVLERACQPVGFRRASGVRDR